MLNGSRLLSSLGRFFLFRSDDAFFLVLDFFERAGGSANVSLGAIDGDFSGFGVQLDGRGLGSGGGTSCWGIDLGVEVSIAVVVVVGGLDTTISRTEWCQTLHMHASLTSPATSKAQLLKPSERQ